MRRAVLFTGHYLGSKRKAGFHWIADALHRNGWEVVFFTDRTSWITKLRKDRAYKMPEPAELNRLVWMKPGLGSFVWFTPWHPISLRNPALDALAGPLFSRYGKLNLRGAEPFLKSADLFVLESGPELLLFEALKRLNPRARTVYRVSDDLRLLKTHPAVVRAEESVADQFNLVSVPSEYMFRRFQKWSNAALHFHGLRKDLFDVPVASPYEPGTKNAVLVGTGFLDRAFVEEAPKLTPDINYHFIGPLGSLPGYKNLVAYGEMPFEDTVPYLLHADVGLQARSYSPGAESLTDSLKMHQYTYCGLPIVAPSFLETGKPHVFSYSADDPASMEKAMRDALAFDRTRVPRESVLDWDALAEILAGPELWQGRVGVATR